MAKKRTLIEGERLNPTIERDMRMSKSTNIGTTEAGLQPCTFDQRAAQKSLFHLIAFLQNQVQCVALICETTAFIWCWLADWRLRDALRMNLKPTS
jgi:hypothetical protein